MIKHICNKQRKLYKNLGCWNIDPNKSERIWPLYFSEKMEFIYRGFRKKWYSNETYIYEVYECIDDDETRYSFETLSQVSKLPYDAIPVTVEIQKEK